MQICSGNLSTTWAKVFYSCLVSLWTNIKCFREVLMIIFLDVLKTDSVRHTGEVNIENNENLQNAQGWRLSLPQTKGNVWNRLIEISKEAFYVLRRIKLGNLWKWKKFKTVMYPPLSKHFLAARSLPQNVVYFTIFFPDFSHLFSD